MQSAIWLIVAVVFAVIEASTAQLVCIWFALGSVCGMIAALFTDNVIIQIVVFLISSAILVALTRKIVNKLMGAKKINTNADSLLGKSFAVTEEVDNDKETGSLKASGTYWSVRNAEEGIIPEGTKVVVERIEGVKLLVRKAE